MRSILFAMIVLALPPVQPARESATFDLDSYLAELDRVTRAISSASGPREAHAFAQSVPDRWWVAAGAQIIVVDTEWIDAAVSSGIGDASRWPAVRANIEQRLATLRMSGAEQPPGGGGSAAETLQAVLARPEFKRGATSRWLEDLRRRVGDWLMRLIDRFTPSGATGRFAAIVFAWTVSLVSLAALVLWLVTYLMRRSDTTWIDIGEAPPGTESARRWAIRALEAARAGDLREAVRCAYHASLCRLHEQGIWTVDESRTPREYLSLLESGDPRYPVVMDLTRRFEQVWYGRRVATEDDARTLSGHLERLGCVTASERAI